MISSIISIPIVWGGISSRGLEQVLKRAGHFYIPVTDKIQATAWFILHFHLETSRHGNPVLESGQELYLLECQHHSPASLPVLTFEVASVGQLGHQLHQQGVRSEPIREDDVFGKWLAFYDPDGNKYLAIENMDKNSDFVTELIRLHRLYIVTTLNKR